MSKPDYAPLVTQQREYFLSGATRPISWRKGQLETLKKMLAENHDELCDALWNDLRRNVFARYHGRWGFEAFTNARGVVYHSARIDPRVRVIHPTRSTRSSGKSKAD